MDTYFLLVPAFLPVIAGILQIFIPFNKRQQLLYYNGAVLVVFLLSVLAVTLGPGEQALSLLTFAPGLHLYFKVDLVSKLFSTLVAVIWLLVGLAAFEYMGHESNEKRFYVFYLIVGGVLAALCYSGNLFTMYVFYELMTLTSMPMVLHSLTHEAIMAALKYMFYSVGGAFMVLFGFFVFASEGNGLYFTPGGVLDASNMSAMTLPAVFMMIVGFGTKAGMFPMHGWLPTAHPVAPAPASAVLSGVITKAGVLGIIRSVFFIAGPDLIRGTWVQYTWIVLALTTVFMGSMLAYKENVLKKRMAYSTVSQVSYILFGLSTLHPIGFIGALMHVVFHSLVKNTLFVSAGAIIYKTGKTKVDQLLAIGKEMPVTMWCFTLVSLTLIGIPPTSAFVSKWYLASGALDSGIPVASWLGPVILLISAVLTAGYLLTISIKGFLPGNTFDYTTLENHEPGLLMLVPMIVMTAGAVLFGVFPAPLVNLISDIVQLVF